MGTSKSAAQLAGKLNRTAKLLDDSEIIAAKAGADVIKRELNAAGSRHGPLHGRGGRPIKLTARYTITGETPGRTVKVRPVQAGAWQIVETGAEEHLIGKTTTRGKRKGKGVFLKGDSYADPVRGPIEHPGIRNPEHLWTRTYDRARPAAVKAIQKAPAKAIRNVFG